MTKSELEYILRNNPNVSVKNLTTRASGVEKKIKEVQQKKVFSNVKSRELKSLGGHSEHDTGNLPENTLFKLALKVFSDSKLYDVKREVMVVEGRKYRADIAVILKDTELKIKGILIELDGYRNHGLSLSGFKKDREKDRLTLLSGYITVRFFASEVLDKSMEDYNIKTLGQLKQMWT